VHVLAFDHRRSLMTSFFGVPGDPTPADVERALLAKRLIWRGLLRALSEGARRESAAALVDATYGGDVIHAARSAGVRTAMPVEASGRDDFRFEVEEWRERLAELDPTWAKALVRYNPDGEPSVNEGQRAQLRELSDHCLGTGRALMLELLVPPTAAQLETVAGDRTRFDRERRAALTVSAIGQLQEAGIEPDLWKHEGFEQHADYERVAASARVGGREGVGCVILGRGEDAAAVERWVRAGAGVDGVVGFAIGRTIWWDPLRAHFDDASQEEAVKLIAANYRRFVDIDDSVIAGRG
jgi:myo-inositol catabolism protein IolC